MWIEALPTAHINCHLKTEGDLYTGYALFEIPEKTFIALDGCVGPAAYHCAFKQMVLIAFKSSTFTCRNCGGGDRDRVAIYRPFGEVSLSLNRTVTCMVLKANDRRTSCPCHDEFRGPRSDYVRQVALATTQQQVHGGYNV
ncbi:uncharacterized protein TNCV_191871 [Trichonephila clavipes]|nr:uncharacterized protein TNCV_191871 [Trichonephila clavipes]